MSKILVVFGATGNQGGSVINHVLNDPQLSQVYRVRAVTRNPSQPTAHNLQAKGVEIVQADAEDPQTLQRALDGASTVFILTTEGYKKAREIAQGKAIADAAVAAGLEYIIYSTLPNVTEISRGRYRKVDYYDSKAETEQYIRSLPIKSAFFAPGCYMQNYHNVMKPQDLGDGTYGIVNFVSPDTLLPLIDITDSGKFVGAILAEPDRFEVEMFAAAEKLYSFDDVASLLSSSLGKTVKYKQVPLDTFRSYLPPDHADSLVETMGFFEDFGYYGPRTRDLVAKGAKDATQPLTTFTAYLTQEPVDL